MIIPKVFPKVVLSRWFTWFNAAYYLREYLDIAFKFAVKENSEEYKCESINEILKILNNEQKLIQVKISLEFIYEFSFQIVKEIRLFESDTITIYELYSKLLNIKKTLENFDKNLETLCLGTEKLMTDYKFNIIQKNAFKKNFSNIIGKMLKNITSRISSYEGLAFLNSLKIFDPKNLINLNSDMRNEIREFPLLDFHDLETQHEWDRLLQNIPLQTETNIVKYWENQLTSFPKIASVTLKSLKIPCTIVPVERAFSIYRRIFSNYRKSFFA